MKKTISTEQTSANIAQVMALLAETPQKLAELSAGLPDKTLHKPLGAGERSFIENLAHLLNTTYAVLAGLVGLYFGGLLIATDQLLAPIVAHAAYDLAALVYLTRRGR